MGAEVIGVLPGPGPFPGVSWPILTYLVKAGVLQFVSSSQIFLFYFPSEIRAERRGAPETMVSFLAR